MYVVVENTPGYLPDDEPSEFEDFNDALTYAKAQFAQIIDIYESQYNERAIKVEIVDVLGEYAKFSFDSVLPTTLPRAIEVYATDNVFDQEKHENN